MAAHVRNNTRA